LQSAVSTDKRRFSLWLYGEMVIVTTPTVLGAWHAQQFWEVLAFACTHSQLVAVDMSGTCDCDARVLTALVMALRYTDTAGVKLRLVLDRGSQIYMSLVDGRLARLFPVYERLPDALA
jgi:hypothetical protein